MSQMAHSTHGSHSEEQDPLSVTNPEHGEHRIVTPFQYFLVYITLLVFTGITVGCAYLDLHWANPVVALAIATFKGCIVILFFMHAFFQSRLIKMTIASGFFVFLVLITMTLTDYMSRAWGRW